MPTFAKKSSSGRVSSSSLSKKHTPVRITVGTLVEELERLAPSGSAEKWDQVGLLAGDLSLEITGAVVSIDLSHEAVTQASKARANVIVTHHPCFFPKNSGISKISASDPVFSAIQKGIAVIACHTNFDQCALEVVQAVAQGLGVHPRGRLLEKTDQAYLSLIVYVPGTHLELVRSSLFEAGAGYLGDYDQCSFSSEGTGTFRGCEDARPFSGKREKFEQAKELRLEVVFPASLWSSVIQALVKSHPYEEVAYHCSPTRSNAHSKGIVRGLGYGFWGDFPSPKRFSEIAKNVKTLFGINGFWITCPEPKFVSRIAFVAGKGAAFIDRASAIDCDLFITGESGYHNAKRGLNQGMGVMEIGHQESETFFIATMKDWLTRLHIEVAECKTPIQKIWAGGTQ